MQPGPTLRATEGVSKGWFGDGRKVGMREDSAPHGERSHEIPVSIHSLGLTGNHQSRFCPVRDILFLSLKARKCISHVLPTADGVNTVK